MNDILWVQIFSNVMRLEVGYNYIRLPLDAVVAASGSGDSILNATVPHSIGGKSGGTVYEESIKLSNIAMLDADLLFQAMCLSESISNNSSFR